MRRNLITAWYVTIVFYIQTIRISWQLGYYNCQGSAAGDRRILKLRETEGKGHSAYPRLKVIRIIATFDIVHIVTDLIESVMCLGKHAAIQCPGKSWNAATRSSHDCLQLNISTDAFSWWPIQLLPWTVCYHYTALLLPVSLYTLPMWSIVYFYLSVTDILSNLSNFCACTSYILLLLIQLLDCLYLVVSLHQRSICVIVILVVSL